MDVHPPGKQCYLYIIYSYWSMAIYPILIWLLVDLPIRKIWVRQLGLWHSQLNGQIKFMFQSPPTSYISIETITDRYSSVQAPQSECPKHSFHPPAMRRVPLVQPQVARNYHPGRWGLGREACRHHLGPCWPFRTWSQHVSDFAGWWLTYPSLKKIWTSVGIILPNIWKHKKCSKPPTSFDFARWELWCILHEIVTIHLEGNNIGRCFTAWSVKPTG